ncbi:MAG: hypothetical protein PWP72_1999 [Thermoanaerobacter sp.]|uniref:hypothetical protein n=1 Tax=Moorella sp. E308F TaxID=2572682 RepID=UPI0010FFB2BE|nr:hypothetical protein [Moorella sp. E308F]MDK2889121.1 hypothetical protein [Thermoanaerobacter sp.]MDN5348566.1 hypothetical protein [Clostridia bacterium]GEA14836.1 hypothetical protein E308F_10800 [Moorella sp. E308F]
MIAVEETKKETATAGDHPHRLVSEEFFFLLNRLDRLDEKLSAKLDDMHREMGGINRWAFSLLVTMLVGFGGIIVTLALGLR